MFQKDYSIINNYIRENNEIRSFGLTTYLTITVYNNIFRQY